MTTSHTSNGSPTSRSNVADDSPASVSQDEGTSPLSLRKESLTSAGHVGDHPLATASHAGGINVDKKPRHKIFKPNFPSEICKGDHLPHLCPKIYVVQRLWSESVGSSTLEPVMVSQ